MCDDVSYVIVVCCNMCENVIFCVMCDVWCMICDV